MRGAWAGIALSLVFFSCPLMASEVTPSALVTEWQTREAIVVDIRFPSEKPEVAGVGKLPVVSLPWPTGAENEGDGMRLSAFFLDLRDIAARYEGREIILLCAGGVRSEEAIKQGERFGFRGRLSHVAGGVLGHDGKPGLIEFMPAP